MDHIAILDKKRKLLSKILSGEKTIESRWTLAKRAPYGRIKKGDVVYFKDSGEPITAKARVRDVLFFCDSNLATLEQIAREYGEAICLSGSFDVHSVKARYITLVFLEKVQGIEPFSIDKRGFGNANAWLCVPDIDSIRVR